VPPLAKNSSNPMHILGDESRYRPNWPRPNLRKNCSPAFAGKLDFGRVASRRRESVMLCER